MHPDDFADAVADEKATELDRLGSQQLLISLTDAELDPPAVLCAAAESEHTAAETFDGWAAGADGERAREAFERLAEQERRHYDRVVGELDEFEPGDAIDPMHDFLRGLDDDVERGGALVGRSLVGERTLLQVVSFFINEADERRADVFRDLRADTRENVEDGVAILADRCEDDDDWNRAFDAATETVQVAYDDYADTLTGMGLDPKPIC
ncbi:rubrerythrin family protein [Haladaptatus sp. CMAA 1911]|uniref:rubrerythrin family protein n=1 Tax=unclassified Haladaptatus TaxID=2622732 RepID=UPI0037550240